MTSSEGFQQHFSIISKYVCCGFYMKKNVAFYTHLFCCTEMRWLFISSTAIWVTRSDTSSVSSRTRTELTSSKCDSTRIWAYLECRWNNPLFRLETSDTFIHGSNFPENLQGHFPDCFGSNKSKCFKRLFHCASLQIVRYLVFESAQKCKR